MALFTLCVTQGELDAAEQLLPTLRGHGDSDELLEGETLFPPLRGDCDAAVACLRRLCVARATQPGTIHAVIDALNPRDGSRSQVKSFARASNARTSIPISRLVGPDTVMAKIGIAAKRHSTAYASGRTCGVMPVRDMSALWPNTAEGIRFKNYLAGHREVFREDSLLWHSIASPRQFGKEADAVDWYFDRPEHIAAEPKLLLDLAVALYKLGKKVESWEMHEAPSDFQRTNPLPLIFSGWPQRYISARLRSGRRPAARRRSAAFAGVLPGAVCIGHKHGRNSCPEETGRHTFISPRAADVGTAANPHLPTIRSDARLNHYYKRCLRRIAKDNGGFFANAWTRLPYGRLRDGGGRIRPICSTTCVLRTHSGSLRNDPTGISTKLPSRCADSRRNRHDACRPSNHRTRCQSSKPARWPWADASLTGWITSNEPFEGSILLMNSIRASRSLRRRGLGFPGASSTILVSLSLMGSCLHFA